MKRINILLVFVVLIISACKKPKLAGNESTGEGLVGFNVKMPASGTIILLNSATPNATIDISWNASTPGLHTAPIYRWIAALKTTGSLDAPLLSILANNAGKDNKLTLTHKQLDDALKAAGINEGVKTELKWTIQATNESVTIKSTDEFNITITRFQDGATPFFLLGPLSSITPFAMDPGSTTKTLSFNWTKSLPAKVSSGIKYKVIFIERKLDTDGKEIAPDFTHPLFSIQSDNNGADTICTVNYKQISDTLNIKGLTNLSLPTGLLWTVVATSGTWNQQSDYINKIVLLREVRLYMPGSYQTTTGNGTNWTPADAPELIRDLRTGLINNMYYTYIWLPANTEFKITEGRSWDVNYGTSSSTDIAKNGDNFKVNSAGVYRISINRETLKYDIRIGRMGFVGGAIPGVGWNPPNVFPTAAMSYISKGRFIGIGMFNADGWKMIDNDQWNDGSKTVSETRSYGSTGPSGSTLVVNGADNMPNITKPGFYRVIWNGSDVNNIKYDTSSATEMRIVGDGINGTPAWDPANSPQMTYLNNGKWQIITKMIPGKNFKFLSGDAWGAFDYEDNGNGTIRWDGSTNMTVPLGIDATKNCTIILDEYTQQWSITQ